MTMEKMHRYANSGQVESVYVMLERPCSYKRIRNVLGLTDTQCDSALRALRAQGKVVRYGGNGREMYRRYRR